MEHPKLSEEEIEIVRKVRAALLHELRRSSCLPDRWPAITLGVVVELAGDVLQMMPGDTEPPAPLCNGAAGDYTSGRTFHCTLARYHEGPCDYERPA